MFKLLILAGAGYLFFTNPGLDDFKGYAFERVEAEQSGARGGWSSVSKAIGIDWLSKKSGLGNYQLCRKNFYLFSVFAVRNEKLFDTEGNIAVGVGAAKQIRSERVPTEQEKIPSQVTKLVVDTINGLNFTECEEVHKPGDMTGS